MCFFTHEEIHRQIYKYILGWAWWSMPIIPAFGRLRQKDLEFKPSLGSI
jgi:hypothetical protein